MFHVVIPKLPSAYPQYLETVADRREGKSGNPNPTFGSYVCQIEASWHGVLRGMISLVNARSELRGLYRVRPRRERKPAIQSSRLSNDYVSITIVDALGTRTAHRVDMPTHPRR